MQPANALVWCRGSGVGRAVLSREALRIGGSHFAKARSLGPPIFKVYYRSMRTRLRLIPPSLRRSTSAAFDIVRELGLAFPRARETRYYRGLALEIDGEVFAVQTSHRSADPNSISVAIEFERREKLIADNPRVFYLRPHYQKYPVVLLRLDQIDRAELSEVLRSAYNAVVSGKVKLGRSRVASRRSTSHKKQIKRRPAR